MFIFYKTKNNKVVRINEKMASALPDGVEVARCDYIPKLNIGEYHEVFNLQEHTETYTEKEPKEVTKKDEVTGKEYTITENVEVEKERTFFTCELAVKVNPEAIKRKRIAELKSKLRAYDYIGVKIATGRATREEYATQIAEMTAWAAEIDELQKL